MSQYANRRYALKDSLVPFMKGQVWWRSFCQFKPIPALTLQELFLQADIKFKHRFVFFYCCETALPSLAILLTWRMPIWVQLIAGVVGYFIPRMVLAMRAVSHRKALIHRMWYTMNMLLAFLALSDQLPVALNRLATMVESHFPEVTTELMQLDRRLNTRADREAVWTEFSQQFGSQDFNAIVRTLYLNQHYGLGSLQSMEKQLSVLHDQRLTRIATSLDKADSVARVLGIICFFPVFFLIILGPVIYRVVGTLQGLAQQF